MTELEKLFNEMAEKLSTDDLYATVRVLDTLINHYRSIQPLLKDKDSTLLSPCCTVEWIVRETLVDNKKQPFDKVYKTQF